MKTKIYIIFFFLLSLASCNKWLDIKPKGQAEASEVLSTEKGYNSALGGVYYMLSDQAMYGKELTYGMMDLLAQYWDVSSTLDHKYYKLALYDYKDAESRYRFNNIWQEFYKSIAQCNLILSSLEQNRSLIKNSELFEGETYALRAFCHLELFRMFGPVIRTNADLDKAAVAYRTDFNTTATDFESGRSVLTKARQDLLKALELLKNDPINLLGRKGDGNNTLLKYNDILNRRGSRMNYYAALGILARVEQSMLNQEQAYVYAKRIIDECKVTQVFSLIDKTNIEALSEDGKDLNYSTEMLFALYTNNLYELTDETFMINAKGERRSSFVITPELYLSFMNNIYGRTPDGSGTDNRLEYWFEANKGQQASQTENYGLTKLRAAKIFLGRDLAYAPEVPILRMSEIYYIACEAQIGKDNALALSYLNEVRATRDLLPLEGTYADEILMEYLVREQCKDFIGEGRMFPLYKRLFRNIYVNSKKEIKANDNIFVFPVPDSEYEYTTNIKPN